MTIIEGIPIRTQPPTHSVNIPAALNSNSTKIADLVHPDYAEKEDDWNLWRLTYKGGQAFIDEYLEKFSRRERREVFYLRKRVTPIPAFAKAAINDVKNAIYQRTTDISRKGGPSSYEAACKGEFGGIDLSTGTMNWFIGNRIIPELLTMAKVGVFIDMPPINGPTLADKGNKHPYLYTYTAENIRNWVRLPTGEFSSLLIRQYQSINDPATGMPREISEIFKLFKVQNGKVVYTIFNKKSEAIGSGTINLPRIPFVVFEITDSLLADVARHQIALMNMESSDISYSLLANFPFYIEQADPNANTSHLKRAQAPQNSEDCTIATEEGDEIDVGSATGRRYAKGMDAPAFINPSTDPLEASMAKQKELKEDIRLLVNLSLSNVKPAMASAESKQMDQQGLESGLSYIGLELEHGERNISEIWSTYEGVTEVATVIYPKRYSLKSDKERQDEADQLAKQMFKVPSLTYRKWVLKQIVTIMIGDRISASDLTTINSEIDAAEVIIGDPDAIVTLVKEGLLAKALAAKSLNLPDNSVSLANSEHADRLSRIAISQSQGAAAEIPDPAARGLPDQVTETN
jgi:hypothetical protein